MSFPSQPRRGVQIDDIVTGLGLLGNVLALPHTVEAQQTENEQMRALLAGSGIPQAQIDAATPEPALRWLSPKQGGFTGKILGGVGDVGAILSTVVGKPVKAPRMTLDEIAAASKLRSETAKAAAQKHLQDVIADPNSTDRDIGAAAVAAGSVEGGVRMMRGIGGGAQQPSSIFAARRMLRDPSLTPERRQAVQQVIDDYEQYQKDLDERRSKLIEGRQPPHYDPAETERMRHEQIMRERRADALARGEKEGTPEFEYSMAYGHPRVERQPPAPTTLDQEIDRERRRRDAMAKDPVLKGQIPNEPVEVTARRNLANRQQAGEAEKSGAPVPPEPPPAIPEKGTPAYDRWLKREALKGAPAAGAQIGDILAGKTAETPTSTTTTTTQPPGADTSDAAADAILGNIDFDSLPADVQQQVHDAAAAGMPKWSLANWLLSLQPQGPPRP